MADDKFIDISQYIQDIAYEPETLNDLIPGLKNKTFTISGTWQPWMPMCGICGEQLNTDESIARVTCEELGYSVLACATCAEPFMDKR